MKLTERQQIVLTELRQIGRANAYRYRTKSASLHAHDCEKISQGDEACAFGLGALTSQLGARIGLTAGAVLSTFKALERQGLVLRESSSPNYLRPLYWWPIGLAAELVCELSLGQQEGGSHE